MHAINIHAYMYMHIAASMRLLDHNAFIQFYLFVGLLIKNSQQRQEQNVFIQCLPSLLFEGEIYLSTKEYASFRQRTAVER